MKSAAFNATRSIHGVVLLSILAVVGVSLIALTISWNSIDMDLYDGMAAILKAFTVFFDVCFGIVAIFIWDANTLFAYVDLVVCIIALFSDVYWFHCYDVRGRLQPTEITLYCLLAGYMTARVWGMAVKPRHRSWKEKSRCNNLGVSVLERLEIIWMARSASLVSKLMPEFNAIYEDLALAWGEENARSVCRFSVYVTDKDSQACSHLKRQFADSRLYRDGCIRFCRPDLEQCIEHHTLELICTRRHSYTCLAFCGSPKLGNDLHRFKISNDVMTAITGNKRHQMEFVSESFGGVKVDKQPKNIPTTENAVKTPVPAKAPQDTQPDFGEEVFSDAISESGSNNFARSDSEVWNSSSGDVKTAEMSSSSLLSHDAIDGIETGCRVDKTYDFTSSSSSLSFALNFPSETIYI
jgi:hypothetical protein